MASITDSIDKLIQEFSKLPGIGQKSAQRLAFYVLKIKKEEAKKLAQTILSVKEKVTYCSVCFNLTEDDPSIGVRSRMSELRARSAAGSYWASIQSLKMVSLLKIALTVPMCLSPLFHRAAAARPRKVPRGTTAGFGIARSQAVRTM